MMKFSYWYFMTLRHTFMTIIDNTDKYCRFYEFILIRNRSKCSRPKCSRPVHLNTYAFSTSEPPWDCYPTDVIWGLATVKAVHVTFLLLLLSIFVSQPGTMAGFIGDSTCDYLVSSSEMKREHKYFYWTSDSRFRAMMYGEHASRRKSFSRRSQIMWLVEK